MAADLVPATFLGDLDWVPGSWLQPCVISGCCRHLQSGPVDANVFLLYFPLLLKLKTFSIKKKKKRMAHIDN